MPSSPPSPTSLTLICAFAQSPFFRHEKGHTIDDSRNAAEAFEALVDELVAGGWEITGRRRGWHLSLRRRTAAARPAVRQPVE